MGRAAQFRRQTRIVIPRSWKVSPRLVKRVSSAIVRISFGVAKVTVTDD
jgi:hypothetical protein